MLLQKKNFEDFYYEIRKKFPGIKELEIWVEYDWKSDGFQHSIIMSEFSREMANWIEEKQNAEAQLLMDTIEK